jgi:nitrogen fixation/metabolism regulation signal transduction histidine kinase
MEFEKEQIGILVVAASGEKAYRERMALKIAALPFIVVLLLIAYYISRRVSLKVVGPIKSLCKVTQEISEGSTSVTADIESDDEVGVLADCFNKMIKELRRHQNHLNELVSERTRDLIRINNELETEVSIRIKTEVKLQELNTHLEQRVEEGISKIIHQEQILVQQSKMAAMGEMIGMIAHQWRQPLNAIGVNVQDLKDTYAFGELDEKYIEQIVDTTMNQVNFMSKTIDDFRNFFVPSKRKLRFDVKSNIGELLSMFIQVFNKSDIDISIKAEPDTLLFTEGYPNEFKQVVLNIMNNSKDAIISKRNTGAPPPTQGRIEIMIGNNKERDKIMISIRDNGGGIPANIIDNIFEPYYTTKEKEGTGLGLYMSKTIVETNMGGTLTVKNAEEGAEFTMILGVTGGGDELTG